MKGTFPLRQKTFSRSKGVQVHRSDAMLAAVNSSELQVPCVEGVFVTDQGIYSFLGNLRQRL